MQTIKVGMVVNLRNTAQSGESAAEKWILVRGARDEYKEWETRLIEIINYISIFITGAHHPAASQPSKSSARRGEKCWLGWLVGWATCARLKNKLENANKRICMAQCVRLSAVVAALSLIHFFFLIFSPLGSSHFNNLAFFTLFDSTSWDIFFLLRLIWDNWGGKLCRKNWQRRVSFSVGSYLPTHRSD